MIKFIRMVHGKVTEKGETDELGFARYQKAHPGEYRVDDKDTPLDPIQASAVIPPGPPDHTDGRAFAKVHVDKGRKAKRKLKG